MVRVFVRDFSSRFSLLNDLLFFGVDLNLLVFDIEPQMVVDAHVLVRYPHKSKPGDKVPAPVGIEKLESSDYEEQRSDIMAKAIFACE